MLDKMERKTDRSEEKEKPRKTYNSKPKMVVT
jgi:hypothetical protein